MLCNNIIGKERVGRNNLNGFLLSDKCTEHDLVITNTLFRQKNMYKTTFMHPHSKHWHLLDYIIVRACDRKDLRITRAMRGTGIFSTDHRLARSIMNTRLASKYRKHQKRTIRSTTSNCIQIHVHEPNSKNPSERYFVSDGEIAASMPVSSWSPTHLVSRQW